MCQLSIIRCALFPFVHVFTLLGVFFSLSNVCTLSIVCTVCAVHCVQVSRCPGVYVAMCSHCFVFSLSCVSVVCVMYSGVQVVVVCCDSVEGVVCVLHVVTWVQDVVIVWIVSSGTVVLLLYVCMCGV